MGRRFLFVGAHPDDADTEFGGTALQLVRKGHSVKFVSLCNGDCGHWRMDRRELAARRFEETQRVARLIGLDEYQVLQHSDCEVESGLENRKEMIRIIRAYRPDVIISHFLWDYHADHRACAQLVQDCAYLVMVPLFCAETPIPEVNPVFAVCYHRFQDPRPFRFDAVVPIDGVLEEKFRMMDCHASQFYEWLPWGNLGMKEFDASRMTWEEKKAFLMHWMEQYKTIADAGRETLLATYGAAGAGVVYAEAFEQSAYGRVLPQEEFRQLFQ